MNSQIGEIFESAFNIIYLIIVWLLVIGMIRRMRDVSEKDKNVARLIQTAFILLAVGDTGHVGFRVLGYLLGGLDIQIPVLGSQMSMAGLGTLATSYTVTLFYMLFVVIWQIRYRNDGNLLTVIALAAGVFRLVIMALPSNNWTSVVPPQPISTLRNLPLIIQGIIVIFLFLSSGSKAKDKTFLWMGWSILISFAFYVPVILFAQQIPTLGLLMIPKTCAYLVVAWIAYRNIWLHKIAE